MNRSARLHLAAALVIVASGCATVSDAPSPPPPGTFTAEVEFPPPMGTKWVVKMTSHNEKTEKTSSESTTWTVMGEGSHRGHPVYHVSDGANVHVYDYASRSWVVVLDNNGRELFAHDPHDGKFSSPLWVGKSWVARSTRHEYLRGRTFYDVVSVWKVTAYEEVQVPAGTFKAFRVEEWPDSRASVDKHLYWYSPSLKIVVKELSRGYGAPYKLGHGRDRMTETAELVEYKATDDRAASGGLASRPTASLKAATAVPIETISNLVFAYATLNRKQQSLLVVDTGSTFTYVTPAQLARLGLSIPAGAPRRQVVAAGGQKLDVPFMKLGAVEVGDALVEDLEVGIFDFAPGASLIGGLLGGDFLQRFRVTIDRVEGQLRLAPLPASSRAGVRSDDREAEAALERHLTTADQLMTKGRYGEAERECRAAAEAEKLGTGGPRYGTLLCFAEVSEKQGKLVDAERLIRRAISIAEEMGSAAAPRVASLLNNLGEIYRQQGKFVEAESLYRRAVEIFERAPGRQERGIATTLGNIVAIYIGQRRWSEAEALYDRVIQLRTEALGREHPAVGVALALLAEIYFFQGKNQQALPIAIAALAITEEALGSNHPQVGDIVGLLASIHGVAGKYEESDQLHRRSLAIRETAFGPDHPRVALNLNNLAVSYKTQARHAEAEPLLQRALTIYEKAYGPDHPEVARAVWNLGDVYSAQQRFTDAESSYRRALAIQVKTFGPDYSDSASILDGLARVLRATDRAGEAAVVEARAQAIRAKQVKEETAVK